MKTQALRFIAVPVLEVVAACAVSLVPLATRAQTVTSGRVEVASGVSVSYPAGWSLAERKYANAVELPTRAGREAPGGAPEGVIQITYEQRLSHDDAVKRLVEIASEVESKPQFLEIGGWPALQRRHLAPVPRVVEQGEGRETFAADALAMTVTTAVAAGDLLIRLEGKFAPGVRRTLFAQAEAIGRTLRAPARGNTSRVRREIKSLRQRARPAPRVPSGSYRPPGRGARAQAARDAGGSSSGGGAGASPAAAVKVQDGTSELEIAASNDGQNIVVATNQGHSFSSDGGQTFGPTVSPLAVFSFPTVGDPSLAVGQSGNVYYSLIGLPNGRVVANNVSGCSTAVGVSTDNGQNFAFRNHAVVCPLNGTNICFPDQPQIAADRFNRATGGDQVYSVWRNFTPINSPPRSCVLINGGRATPSITCSANGGNAWNAPLIIGAGDFAKVAVGQDGFVYVLYRSGQNLMLNKYSSCANGLTQQAGFPVTVATTLSLACPIPGLDRCGILLSSPTLAVDDTLPSHIYVAYAETTASNNENVVVRDSVDGGRTWPRSVVLNAPVEARRFMPWVCSAGGSAYVSWYDRRAAGQRQTTNTPWDPQCASRCEQAYRDCMSSGALPFQCAAGRRNCLQACTSVTIVTSNDLTEFFAASASPTGTGLLVNPEMNLSGRPDPQCAADWPCAVSESGDSEGCSVQPQLAGRCMNSMGFGSGIRCDFSSPTCPAGGTCTLGGGCPKYGDYNGNACAAGRAFFAWASATAPTGLQSVTNISIFFTSVSQSARLTVVNVSVPSGDSGRFNLLIDGIVRATAVGNHGTTGPQLIRAGVHTVGKTAATANTVESNYSTAIGGDCAANGTVTLAPGDNKTCTITSTRLPGTTGSQCRADCQTARQECMATAGQPGQPTHARCNATFNTCIARCR